jgi:hypothetical protein
VRVSYIGNFGPLYSTENDVRVAFEAIGWSVDMLQENEINKQQILDSVAGSDLLLITGTWDDAIRLHDWLDIMHSCAKQGIPTATLHLDTFWSTNRGGRKWWHAPMFHTAYIFTADGDYQKEWRLLGKNHQWLPPAVRHSAVKEGTKRDKYTCDVAFVGSNGRGYHEDVWPDRKLLVDKLRTMCERNGWGFLNPGGDHPKIERGDDMNDFYASAKITVGDSLCLKRELSNYASDRVFEAPGRGGFLIMPRLNWLRVAYDNNLPMYNWDDFEELENSIIHYLSDDEAREETRKTCMEIVRGQHTYVDRVQTIIKAVGLSDV